MACHSFDLSPKTSDNYALYQVRAKIKYVSKTLKNVLDFWVILKLLCTLLLHFVIGHLNLENRSAIQRRAAPKVYIKSFILKYYVKNSLNCSLLYGLSVIPFQKQDYEEATQKIFRENRKDDRLSPIKFKIVHFIHLLSNQL